MSAEDALGQQFTQRRAKQLAAQGQSLMRGKPQPTDAERTGPTGLIRGGKSDLDAVLDKVPSFNDELDQAAQRDKDAATLRTEYERLDARSKAMRAAKTSQGGVGRGSRLDTCVVCSQVVPADPAKRGKCFGFTRSHYTPRDQLRVVGKEER